MTDDESITPWYRQFWPWFLIALPATAVVAGIATLIIAMHDPDGLVADDYYKEGLAINKELARDNEARRLGISALVRREPEKGIITVILISPQAIEPDALRLRLLHTTRANFDQQLTLPKVAAGTYQASLGDVPQGQWNVELQPADSAWRLTGRISLTELAQIQLSPDQ